MTAFVNNFTDHLGYAIGTQPSKNNNSDNKKNNIIPNSARNRNIKFKAFMCVGAGKRDGLKLAEAREHVTGHEHMMTSFVLSSYVG